MFWFWPLPATADLLESPTKNVTILVVTPSRYGLLCVSPNAARHWKLWHACCRCWGGQTATEEFVFEKPGMTKYGMFQLARRTVS